MLLAQYAHGEGNASRAPGYRDRTMMYQAVESTKRGFQMAKHLCVRRLWELPYALRPSRMACTQGWLHGALLLHIDFPNGWVSGHGTLRYSRLAVSSSRLAISSNISRSSGVSSLHCSLANALSSRNAHRNTRAARGTEPLARASQRYGPSHYSNSAIETKVWP
jgi:hypothetical protein